MNNYHYYHADMNSLLEVAAISVEGSQGRGTQGVLLNLDLGL